MIEAIRKDGLDSMAVTLSAMARDEGSAAHRWCRPAALTAGKHAARNLADAIHYLVQLHGSHPALIDQVQLTAQPAPVRAWLEQAAAGFVEERANLANLVGAAGPMPSTPGQAECETAIQAQRHAFSILAESGRTGCAIGAAAALLLDWVAIRALLDDAAERLGVTPLPVSLPGTGDTLALVDSVAETQGIARAMLFGARQLLGQQRGLWDLLEARRAARDRG
ncbi:hypothetical protein FHS96_004595 [Sphingomonas zeicaulis]|uniref:DUF6975 family protein n=1 Tax=Sphingomonas zeicaulis TaxID=1632740 RepID=UPI003D1F30BC